MGLLIGAIVLCVLGIVLYRIGDNNDLMPLQITGGMFAIIAAALAISTLLFLNSYGKAIGDIKDVQVKVLEVYQTSDKTDEDYEWLLEKLEETNTMLTDLKILKDKYTWIDIFIFFTTAPEEFYIEIADGVITLPEEYQYMITPKRPENYGVEDDTEDVVTNGSSEIETVVIEGKTYAMIGNKLYEVVEGKNVETTAVEYNSNVLVVDTSTDDIEDISEEGLYGE